MKLIEINKNKIKGGREQAVLILLKFGAQVHQKLCFRRKAWLLNLEALKACPVGSLGNSLLVFYTKEQFGPIPKAELHDVYHVLTGYGTGVREESAMQFLLLGNGKRSWFTVGCCLVAMMVFPEWIHDFKMGFRYGRSMRSFCHHDFSKELHTRIEFLRNHFAITPVFSSVQHTQLT